MSVLLVGANPGLLLHDAGERVAFVSVWRVDWSARGSGAALVLWHDGAVRLLAPDPDLSGWLAEAFTRHFPEVAGLPWPEPTYERADVEVRMNLETGMRATAGDVEVELSEVLDRRRAGTDAFDLDGVPHGLSLVYAPCARARLAIAGRPVVGQPEIGGTPERPSSSAFLAEAEVWSTPPA